MNFFGHAVAACFRTQDARFVLGAMLPDFASMCGARLTESSGDVGAGVAMHHETDAVFHRLGTFKQLARELQRTLRDRGVNRGSALAGGHVAVELLLDGYLTENPGNAATVYVAALAAGNPDRLAEEVTWSTETDHKSWEALRQRLVELGLPVGYRDPSTVADRVIRVLSERPLLAVPPGEHPALRQCVMEYRETVVAQCPELIANLRAGLCGSNTC